MSWDSYLDNLVAQSKDKDECLHVDKACIVGMDGSPWTTDGHQKNIQLDDKEGVTIANCFKAKDFSKLQAEGIYIKGEKYQFLREQEGKLILGKKKDKGAVSIQCTKTAMVIAHCPEGGQQGQANKAVGVIADYLESLNY